jgi:hypothetical protein
VGLSALRNRVPFEENVGGTERALAMHSVRYYKVRLHRSGRLRYRIARRLLRTTVWLPLILLVILGTAYIVRH